MTQEALRSRQIRLIISAWKTAPGNAGFVDPYGAQMMVPEELRLALSGPGGSAPPPGVMGGAMPGAMGNGILPITGGAPAGMLPPGMTPQAGVAMMAPNQMGVIPPDLLPAATTPPDQLRTVVLANMVTPAEVDEYLEEEVREGTAKYGQITAVAVVPRGPVVFILVSYATTEMARAAVQGLNGRFFARRRLVAVLTTDAPSAPAVGGVAEGGAGGATAAPAEPEPAPVAPLVVEAVAVGGKPPPTVLAAVAGAVAGDTGDAGDGGDGAVEEASDEG